MGQLELASVQVPTLVIHGDADRIVPFASSGQPTAKNDTGSTASRGRWWTALHILDTLKNSTLYC